MYLKQAYKYSERYLKQIQKIERRYRMLVNVEAERVRNQLTKEELANKLGVSLKTYYNWVNEERDVPSKKLKQMALLFGTSMDYLLKGCTGTTKN